MSDMEVVVKYDKSQIDEILMEAAREDVSVKGMAGEEPQDGRSSSVVFVRDGEDRIVRAEVTLVFRGTD